MITLFMKSYLTQLGKVSTLSQLLTEQFSSQLLEKLFFQRNWQKQPEYKLLKLEVSCAKFSSGDMFKVTSIK